MNDDNIVIVNPINPIYHENQIYVSNAKPIDEPQYFSPAFEINEADSIRINTNFKLKDCLECCSGFFCFSMVCFVFFLFMGGATLFFNV